jgi:hypothetical protein
MPLPTEQQPLTENTALLNNDQRILYYVSLIMSRNALAPKVATIPDYRSSIWVISSGFTLPTANFWGSGRSPIILIRNITAGALTITAAGGNTIEGAASYNLAAGTSAVLFTDGNTKWYVK